MKSVTDLVVEHAEWIRNKARKYYDNTQDADDLAGDTIYRCLRGGASFDPTRGFKPWATAIMQNLYITRYHHAKLVTYEGLGEYDCYEGYEYADQRAKMHSVMHIIRILSPKSVSIGAVLLYARGYSISEIAATLEIPKGTVKSRISTGRALLKEALRC